MNALVNSLQNNERIAQHWRGLAANLLLNNGWKLATAESCTGGLIAATCTDLAGSSDWFERGFVTYSNASKTELLGVDAGTLAVGAEADLALVDPERPWIVDSRKMAASAGNTPFDRQPVQGRALALWKGGTLIRTKETPAG